MKVRVPVLIKDQVTWREYFPEVQPEYENFLIKNEEFFLDGPVTKRVAVLDFDPKTGALLSGARYVPPGKGKKIGHYEIRNIENIQSRDFNQVSVFGTVIKVMYMYEEEDALGRPLNWAFDAPQLLVPAMIVQSAGTRQTMRAPWPFMTSGESSSQGNAPMPISLPPSPMPIVRSDPRASLRRSNRRCSGAVNRSIGSPRMLWHRSRNSGATSDSNCSTGGGP